MRLEWMLTVVLQAALALSSIILVKISSHTAAGCYCWYLRVAASCCMVCAEMVGDVDLHGRWRGSLHDAVTIPLYMYPTVSLTRLFLYFRKFTVLIILMSKVNFCLLFYTLPALSSSR
ncbi:hypothetical protein BS78_04G124500 [Paspalum vaginatum]|nr:hypothetical protein BS78_04G124500 [Paspalum vaginatum]